MSPSTWAWRPRPADPSWGSLGALPRSRRRPAGLGRVRLRGVRGVVAVPRSTASCLTPSLCRLPGLPVEFPFARAPVCFGAAKFLGSAF
eukprot:10187342-Heterocapsa_arctica.AAC.1